MQRIRLSCNDQKPPGNRAKKAWILSGTRRRLLNLGFPNSENKSFLFIYHERSVDELMSKYFSQIFTKRAID